MRQTKRGNAGMWIGTALGAIGGGMMGAFGVGMPGVIGAVVATLVGILLGGYTGAVVGGFFVTDGIADHPNMDETEVDQRKAA